MKKHRGIIALSILVSLFLVGCSSPRSEPSDNTSVDKRYEIYQLAVDAGYQGTYEEWLQTIKGKDGVDGKDGSDGTSLLTGNGVPSSSMGKNGDSYIDLDTWDFYVKESNEWVKKGNIKGPSSLTDADNPQQLDFYLLSDDTYGVRIGNCFAKEIVIPSIYHDKAVTRILWGGFNLHKFWDSFQWRYVEESCIKITIPTSIKTIDEEAFGHYAASQTINYLGTYEEFKKINFPDEYGWIHIFRSESGTIYSPTFVFTDGVKSYEELIDSLVIEHGDGNFIWNDYIDINCDEQYRFYVCTGNNDIKLVNGEIYDSFTVVSSNEDVCTCTIEEKGRCCLTAISQGNATLTITYGDIVREVTVNVINL